MLVTILQHDFEITRLMAVIALSETEASFVSGKSPAYLNMRVLDPLTGGSITAQQDPLRWGELLPHHLERVRDISVHTTEELTPDAAAQILQMSRASVCQFMDAGALPFRGEGNERRIKASAVESFRRSREEGAERAERLRAASASLPAEAILSIESLDQESAADLLSRIQARNHEQLRAFSGDQLAAQSRDARRLAQAAATLAEADLYTVLASRYERELTSRGRMLDGESLDQEARRLCREWDQALAEPDRDAGTKPGYSGSPGKPSE